MKVTLRDMQIDRECDTGKTRESDRNIEREKERERERERE